MAMALIIKELKTNVLKENVLVKADTIIANSGSTKQHSVWTYHDMSWCELPPDENGFHKLDGKYHAIFTGLPAASGALLKLFFCNCKTDCSTGGCTCLKYYLPRMDMCGVCQGLTSEKHRATNKHGYLSVSDRVMIVTIAVYTGKLGIPY